MLGAILPFLDVVIRNSNSDCRNTSHAIEIFLATKSMAKGRKGTLSHHERYLGSFGYNSSHGNGIDGSELGEEDVWSMVDNVVDHHDHVQQQQQQALWSPRGSHSNGRSRRWTREDRRLGGLSLAFDDHDGRTPSPRILHQFHGQENVAASQRGRTVASSAPVNVPNWSKFIRVESVESLQDSDDGLEDENDSDRVPPHEYLAREYAKSHKMAGIAATSVFEGMGRTLKGRDLRRVRDAVWSQTGFDG